MGDIFMHGDIKKLLKGKFVLIMGDSNLRALYRDVIWLLNNNSIIPQSHLRRKLDFSYVGDKLLKQGELNRGRDYVEMREYNKNDFRVKYNFLTKCYTKEIEQILDDIKRSKYSPPDVVLINSCLWDITRWGPNGVNIYKENMQKLFQLFKTSLPSKTLVVFSTTLPVSNSCKGAFLVKQVEFMTHSLRFEVMEANLFARQLVPTFGYNILDFHYHFRMQIHRRAKDGVHWIPQAVRHMTNLFLTHISLSWDVQLPGNFRSRSHERMESNIKTIRASAEVCNLPQPRIFPSAVMPPPDGPPKSRKQLKLGRKILGSAENISPYQGRQQPLANAIPIEVFYRNLCDIKRVVSTVSNSLPFTYIMPSTSSLSNMNRGNSTTKLKNQVHKVSKLKNDYRIHSRHLPY